MPHDAASPEPAAEESGADEAALRLTLSELKKRLDTFLSDYLKNKSKETVGTYRRSLNEFERWFVRQGSRFRFREGDIRAYKTYLMKERELSQVSISTYLTAVRRFCQYLTDAGLLEENPAKAVKGNRRPDSHSRAVLTEADIAALMDVLETETLIGKRDNALVHLMLHAGLSEIELVRADYKDLEQTLLGWFLRVQSKGRTVKDQQAPLDPPVAEELQRYLDARGRLSPGDPLFVSHGHRSRGARLNTRSVRSRINKHLKEAGIKRRGLTPHSLTHTAALIWLNDGMAVGEVKQRMRHGTLETTMIYYKKQGLLKRDPEELKEIGQ